VPIRGQNGTRTETIFIKEINQRPADNLRGLGIAKETLSAACAESYPVVRIKDEDEMVSR
jgi:hypothetical protein